MNLQIEIPFLGCAVDRQQTFWNGFHEHMPEIRLIIRVGYDSTRGLLKWIYDHRDRCIVESLSDYIYKSVCEGYGASDFCPWLHELCDV